VDVNRGSDHFACDLIEGRFNKHSPTTSKEDAAQDL
jgi:hypothetical protein